MVSSNRRDAPLNLGLRSGEFTIVDRYPKPPNNRGDVGSILLKQGMQYICKSCMCKCKWVLYLIRV